MKPSSYRLVVDYFTVENILSLTEGQLKVNVLSTLHRRIGSMLKRRPLDYWGQGKCFECGGPHGPGADIARAAKRLAALRDESWRTPYGNEDVDFSVNAWIMTKENFEK